MKYSDICPFSGLSNVGNKFCLSNLLSELCFCLIKLKLKAQVQEIISYNCLMQKYKCVKTTSIVLNDVIVEKVNVVIIIINIIIY